MCEQFPDIIILTEDGLLVRPVTTRAAEWTARWGNLPLASVKHQTVSVNEDFVLDAYMSGMSIRTHSGHSLL